MNDKPHLKMGMVRIMWPILNFGVFSHISGMAEIAVVKFCTQVGSIKS